MTLVTFH